MKRYIFSFLVLCVTIFIFTNFTNAGWYNPEWRFRKPITVYNFENDSVLVDYPIKIEVRGNKQFNSDFSDLRFTESDGKSSLSYWIEDCEPGTKVTVWVRVPYIPANNNTMIYMYYGNLKANSGSDGNGTFYFSDDFNDCNISDWNIVSGNWHASNCFLEQTVYANRLKILSSYEITKPVIVKAKLNHISGDPYFAIHIMFSKDSYCGNGYYFGYGGINRGGTMISKVTDGNVVQLVTDSTIQNCMYPNEWLDITIWFKGNGIYDMLLEAPDGKKVALETHHTLFQKPFTLGLWVGDHTGCDDIIVYKYTGHPPKFFVGNEELNPGYYPIDKVQLKDVFNFPNPARIGDKIYVTVPLPGLVTFSVYDISGRLVSRPLDNVYLIKGKHSVLLLSPKDDNRGGVYFLDFCEKSGSENILVTEKVVLLR